MAAYGVYDGAKTFYEGITSENKYDRAHDIANGSFSLGGTIMGATIGTAILPGVGTAIGGGVGYLVGKLGGFLADDKIADYYAFGDKATSKYADEGRKPITQETIDMLAAPTDLIAEIGDAAAGLKDSSQSLLELSNQSLSGTSNIAMPAYATSGLPDCATIETPVELALHGEKRIENQIDVIAEDFGIPKTLNVKVDACIYGQKSFSDSPRNWRNHHAYRGGIIGYADGGYVHGGAQLITVAEEGTPEAIIPLGKHRRKRALELFQQVGGYLQVPGFSARGFATGGIAGGSIGTGSIGGGIPSMVEVGGVEIKVEAKDGRSLIETIRENKEAISEEIAGVFNAAFRGQFANTPATGI